MIKIEIITRLIKGDLTGSPTQNDRHACGVRQPCKCIHRDVVNHRTRKVSAHGQYYAKRQHQNKEQNNKIFLPMQKSPHLMVSLSDSSN
jgi:hypothetical protein